MYEVKRDGDTIASGFSDYASAFGFLLGHQSASVEHATEHEGYSIELLDSVHYLVESYDADGSLLPIDYCENFQDTYAVKHPLGGHQIVRHIV